MKNIMYYYNRIKNKIDIRIDIIVIIFILLFEQLQKIVKYCFIA
jgi:hypothetical protein